MVKLPGLIEFHDKAMFYADKAYIARKRGDIDASRHYAFIAMKYEIAAAKMLLPVVANEPTRSVLYRSAATLALWAGDYETAFNLAVEGNAMGTPCEIRRELQEIERAAGKRE